MKKKEERGRTQNMEFDMFLKTLMFNVTSVEVVFVVDTVGT